MDSFDLIKRKKIFYTKQPVKSVRDVTWMSDLSIHLAKWMAALEQVTVMQTVKISTL